MDSNELPKVIEKSQADIDAAVAAIKASDIPSGIKKFAISCIRLAVWLPKALLEHKIKLSNLRKLIFGFGRRNKKSSKNDNTQANAKDELENNNTDTTSAGAKMNEENGSIPDTTNPLRKPGHGRLPHSAYTNTVEHHPNCNSKPGDFCPAQCGGKLYNAEPGIIVCVTFLDRVEQLYRNQTVDSLLNCYKQFLLPFLHLWRKGAQRIKRNKSSSPHNYVKKK